MIQIPSRIPARVRQTLLMLLIFMIIYVLVTCIALALGGLAIWAGIQVITLGAHWMSFIFGGGLVFAGILLILFVFMFSFKSGAKDSSWQQEITDEAHPELFRMLRELTASTGAEMPAHVYLRFGVEAYVAFKHPYLSIVGMSGKTLTLGLGLVNTLTQDELRAVIAHEFGHFGQRSMRLGVLMYSVNTWLYRILYAQEPFSGAIETMGNIHGVLGMVGLAGQAVMKGLQEVLRFFHRQLNLSYMQLSREMEYHADAVAASVAGPDALSDALLRLEIAEHDFDRAIDVLNTAYAGHRKLLNVYQLHQREMLDTAKLVHIPVQMGLPLLSMENYEMLRPSGLNIHKQWMSHPDTPDRVKHVGGQPHAPYPDALPAWTLFRDPDAVQRNAILSTGPEACRHEEHPWMEGTELENFLAQEIHNNQHPSVYGGFYNGFKFPARTVPEGAPATDTQFADIFDAAYIFQQIHHRNLQNDLETLRRIQSREIVLRSFDYKGERYPGRDAAKLAQKIRAEILKTEADVAAVHQRAWNLALAHARKQGRELELRQAYELTESWSAQFEKDQALLNEILKAGAFIDENLEMDVVVRRLKNLSRLENELRERIHDLQRQPLYKHVSADIRKALQEYAILVSPLLNTQKKQYDMDAIDRLKAAIMYYPDARHIVFSHMVRTLLEYQLSLETASEALPEGLKQASNPGPSAPDSAAPTPPVL